jgi:hypothetical protein
VGKSVSPKGVKATILVVLVNNFSPNSSSSFEIPFDSVGCVTWQNSAALLNDLNADVAFTNFKCEKFMAAPHIHGFY